MKNEKIKVVVAGMEFKISSDAVRSTDYWGKPLEKPYIYGGPKVAGEFVKQYVKAKYPQLECSVKGEHFANGNSMHANVWYMDGTPVEDVIVKDINSFAHLFEYGRYDGMHDIYESYETSGLTSDSGMKVDAGVKYVGVENRPNHNSVTHHILMLRGMVKGEYNFGPVSLDEAVLRAKKWGYKGPNFEKAILLAA